MTYRPGWKGDPDPPKGQDMQDRPVCFRCDEPILTNGEMVFEAPCGHPDGSSAVFHGLCLMDWREHREEWMQRLRRQMDALNEAYLSEDDED